MMHIKAIRLLSRILLRIAAISSLYKYLHSEKADGSTFAYALLLQLPVSFTDETTL